jgi:hypothetical protein
MLIYVSGGKDFSLVEYDEVVKAITRDIHPDANVIPGMNIDPAMGDKMRVTVIATGFESAACRNPQAFPNTEKTPPKLSEIISEADFADIRDGTKRQYDFLPHRNGYAGEDLEIPTLIRDRRFVSSGGDASGKTGSN